MCEEQASRFARNGNRPGTSKHSTSSSTSGQAGFYFKPILPTLAALLFTVLTSSPLLAQSEEATMVVRGQTPRQVSNGTAIRTGHYEPTNMLRLAIVLSVPHPAEEKQFLEDVQDKQSPLFHQFLSPEDWTVRFGPSAENEQAVVDWAKSAGLTLTHRYKNRLVVDLEAPAGTIEKALNLTINSYQLPAEGGLEARTVYSNDRDPSLPAHLNGVVDAVLGLNDVLVARPRGGTGKLVPRPDYVPGPVVEEKESVKRDAVPQGVAAVIGKDGPRPDVAAPSCGGCWTPSDMFSSYAYDYGALMNQGHCCNPLNNTSGHSPRESSIAIASFGNVNLTDDVVNGFATYFNLAVYASTEGIDGGYTCSGTGDDNCGEVTLDTEWSLAMANSLGAASDTARVVVYEGSTYSNAVIMDVYNQMEDDAHARTMTTSWGWGENTQFSSNPEMDTYNATMASVDKVFSSMSGEGWTLIAASGDNGAVDECQDALRVDFPSTDPNVIAAGGTELNEGNPYEVAWTGGTKKGSCLGNGGGSTGGFSEYWGAPSYQSFLGFSKRAVPDLSLDAMFGHDVYLNGKWAFFGGTSDVAPMLAGFFAQENAYLLSIGNKCGSATAACAPIGNANYPIYREAQYKNAAHYPFYDMIKGCNSNDITILYNITPYCAKVGYDEVTGWGSANMLQLAWAINWYTAAASGSPYVTFSGPATNKWYNTNQTVSWKVVDYAGGTSGVPGTGIAGESQSWDAPVTDAGSEPHGGSGNAFYSGPQFPNGATGCLAFSDNGCSGGASSQGCHTAHVLGWNNQGMTTGDATYGPLCYDTVAPTTSISNNPTVPASGWYNKQVTFTLSANDSGGSNASGVSSTLYQVNNAFCLPADLGYCSVYSGPFSISSSGLYTIYYFSEDNAGNYGAQASESVKIDTVAPVTTATVSGTLNGKVYDTAVGIMLSATDNLSGVHATYYQVDGGTTTSYSAPFQVTTLGTHVVKFWSVDVAGNTESSHSVTFTVGQQLQGITFPAITGAEYATTNLSLVASASSGLAVTFKSTTTAVCKVSGATASLLAFGTCTIEAMQPGNTTYLAAPVVSQSFGVRHESQTVNFATISSQVVGNNLDLSATASSGLAVTFKSTTPAVCTVSGTTATMIEKGKCSLEALQGGNDAYLGADAIQSFTVDGKNQTITFPAITTEEHATTKLSLTASASSGLAVSFKSTTPTVCTVSGKTATLLIFGKCTIEASQSGNDFYAAAPEMSQSFRVSHAKQTIDFPLIKSQVVGKPLALVATASSGLTVSFKSTTTTVCTVSGTTATMIKAGTCTLQALQDGNDVYLPATTIQQSFSVTQ